MDSAKLMALLALLGPDYAVQGHTDGPMPVVSIEAFFDGNDDPASMQVIDLAGAEAGLREIRGRAGVSDVRLGVTQWEGEGTWPLAEYIFVVTEAQPREVRGWLEAHSIHVDEIGAGEEHRARWVLDVPDGQRVVWAWID